MGLMLFRKRPLANSIMSGNPNKKIKLDFQNDGNAGNDDLWGQDDDDITAEEFDLLEIQATQSCNQNSSLLNNTLQSNNLHPKSSTSLEVHDSKQLQYELEGRVKLLSLSLEKSTKELNEERLNRERLINERIKQFHERECNMKKEVEKMQSILEFKEQEMKISYSKMQILKSQLQDKKGINTDVSVNSNFDDFLKSSKCDGQSIRHKSFPEKYHRKHKLSIDIPKGEVNGIEILSSILCSRLSVLSFLNKENIVNSGCLADSSCSSSLTPVTVLRLKNEQKCDEILDYYCDFLKNHVNLLKTLTSKNNQVSSNRSSSISAKPKEAFYSQTVVTYLTDIIYIYSSTSFKFHHPKSNTQQESPSKSLHIQKSERESSSHAEQNEKVTVSDSTLTLLQSLSVLSNPETYPIGYHKDEEIEFALSALLSICLSCPKDFLDLIGKLPCYFLSNPHQSVAGLCTTIKLFIALCSNKSFISYLAHTDSNCIFCLIASFLHVAVPTDAEKFAISITLVEDLLSSIFSIHNYKEIQFTSSCMSAGKRANLPQLRHVIEVIQGIIKSLWKYFQIREDHTLSYVILKKGFLLLHFISSNIPNFKENRNPVEDEYVSLISGVLAFSKENSELREFYDLIPNLWDFQTDMPEFDLDELSEEAHACTNDIDIE